MVVVKEEPPNGVAEAHSKELDKVGQPVNNKDNSTTTGVAEVVADDGLAGGTMTNRSATVMPQSTFDLTGS